MSKYVKNLIVDHVGGRLQGVGDVLLVDVNIGRLVRCDRAIGRGIGASGTFNVLAVKNSLAARGRGGHVSGPGAFD